MDAIGRAGAGRYAAGARRSSVFIACLLLWGVPTFARQPQQSAEPSAKPWPETRPDRSPVAGPDDTDAIQKDRIFSLVPNFMTVDQEKNHQIPPLSAGEKYKLFAESAFDPGAFLVTGIIAGEQQAADCYPQWGQGAAGYGKRFASTFADQTIEGFTTSALFPALFHQDPRYFRLGEGGFWHRTGYALSRIVVTRNDSAHNSFNLSEVLGATAAAVSIAYHPRTDRTWTGAGSTVGTDVAVDTLSNFFREFWPDIEHRLHWKQLPF